MKYISIQVFFIILLTISSLVDAFQCAPSTATSRVCPFCTAQVLRRATEPREPQRNSQNQRRVSIKMDLIAEPTLLFDHVVSYFPTFSITPGDPIVGLAHSRPSPAVEAEILSDMSHVALDLFGFLNPEQLLLRLFALLGRIMFMAAEYDVHEKISTEEMLFQGGMLTLSAKQFVVSWRQRQGTITQRYGDASFRDRAVYQVFFSPVGVSWLQFRSLVASCIDWVEAKPYETLDTLENDKQVAYWIYNGRVTVRHSRTSSPFAQDIHHRRGKPVVGKCSVDMDINSKTNGKKTTKKNLCLLANPSALSALMNFGHFEDDNEDGCSLQVTAGVNGATMMRINLSKLRALMDDDEELGKTVRNLVLLSMQSKMETMLAAADNEMALPAAQSPCYN